MPTVIYGVAQPFAQIQFSSIFITLKNSLYLSAFDPYSHSQPQATIYLLSISINLPFMDISYKWNHIYRVYIGLISLRILFLRSTHVDTGSVFVPFDC